MSAIRAGMDGAELELLRTIFWMDVPSRLRLVEQLKFSKSKVTSIVTDLIECGLVEESEELPSSGGRRPAGLMLNDRLGMIVGVDLDATGVSVSLCTANTSVLGIRSAATDIRIGPVAVLATIVLMIDDLLGGQGCTRAEVIGIGIGVPGPVEIRTGLLISPPLMPNWEGFSIREYLSEHFEAPVMIDNDVNLMALGELHHIRLQGLSAGNENFIVVKLGTGIGAGVIAHGQVFRGADGAAGDIGHICVDPDGPRCHCGNAGCLEVLAGAPGIVRDALEAAQRAESPIITALALHTEVLTVREVGLAARQGDEAANRIIQQAGNRVGQVLAGLVNFMNPSHVLIGGGVSHVGPLLLASIRQSIYARSLPLSTRKLQIDHTRLGERAGLHGAAVLAVQGSVLQGIAQ